MLLAAAEVSEYGEVGASAIVGEASLCFWSPSLSTSVESAESIFTLREAGAVVVGESAVGGVVAAGAGDVEVVHSVTRLQYVSTGRADCTQHTVAWLVLGGKSQNGLQLDDFGSNQVSGSHRVSRCRQESVDNLCDEDVAEKLLCRQVAVRFSLDVEDLDLCGLGLESVDLADDDVTHFRHPWAVVWGIDGY